MFKLVIFLLGLAAGAGGATAWLLSEPAPAGPTDAGAENTWQARVQELRERFNQALAEGQRQGGETETRLRGELDAYRGGRA